MITREPGALFKKFHEAIRQRADADTWVYEVTDTCTLRFPSASSEVGDLIVYDDGEELTLGVEKIYHTHFNPEFGPNFDRSSEEADQDYVVKEAITFIDELLKDRMILWICYLNGQAFSAGACPVDETEYLPEKAVCYVWSGKWLAEK